MDRYEPTNRPEPEHSGEVWPCVVGTTCSSNM